MGRYDDYKQHVLRISQRLSADGYFGSKSGSAGNVSMLVEGENAVVVTPTRLQYDVMKVEDICVVDFDLAPIEGARKPSIETPMHVAAYQVREDVSAVIHTHQTFASALSILNEGIPPLFDEVTLAIGNTIDVVPYALQARANCTTTSRASSPIDAIATYFRITARSASAPTSTRLSLSWSCSKNPRTSMWMRSGPGCR